MVELLQQASLSASLLRDETERQSRMHTRGILDPIAYQAVRALMCDKH